jgi:RHO1 GDP-GTP exchange protein 1/2
VDKHGVPSRSSGYLRWESTATSYAHRGEHVLLFSPDFVEIRNVTSGRLIQVIEASDIRLLHTGLTSADPLLIAMTGTKSDEQGLSEKIVELTQTAELRPTPLTGVDSAWEEWDMA